MSQIFSERHASTRRFSSARSSCVTHHTYMAKRHASIRRSPDLEAGVLHNVTYTEQTPYFNKTTPTALEGTVLDISTNIWRKPFFNKTIPSARSSCARQRHKCLATAVLSEQSQVLKFLKYRTVMFWKRHDLTVGEITLCGRLYVTVQETRMEENGTNGFQI
jgi:hypothetical protein